MRVILIIFVMGLVGFDPPMKEVCSEPLPIIYSEHYNKSEQMEIFKNIKGHEGLYQVSNSGNVKSLKRIDANKHEIKERILKPSLTNKGYFKVVLSINGIIKSYSIHRLVSETFISNPKNKRTVNHKNGIRTDNRVSNLEWATYSENHKHSFRELGRISPNKGKELKGKLVLHLMTGIFYDTMRLAANAYNHKEKTLSNRLIGRLKNNTDIIYA